jgi:hypothetical protein
VFAAGLRGSDDQLRDEKKQTRAIQVAQIKKLLPELSRRLTTSVETDETSKARRSFFPKFDASEVGERK